MKLTASQRPKMESNGLRRKDTTKGPPLRILSLGKFKNMVSPSLQASKTDRA